MKDNGEERYGSIIGKEVDADRIADDATIHPGCRIIGSKTLICKGAELGYEGPVTIKDCFVGPNVKLKGGYFETSVFLEGAEAGSGAHVRAGTILEEHASIAHTVGLKQTILFPFVTLGSLINFCDCLMAGGTGKKNHSEVGSSYIHFNYTPNQDKATASLIGDVPKGVMINQKPIFLGGQGGMVGPCRIAYGTIIAAGSVYRKDQRKPDRLVFAGGGRGGSLPYTTGVYGSVKRQAVNNIVYMANLVSLMAWYHHVRSLFIGDRFPRALYDGLLFTMRLAIDERIKRFVAFCEKLEESKRMYQDQLKEAASSSLVSQKEELFENRLAVRDVILHCLDHMDRLENRTFSSIIQTKIGTPDSDYVETIRGLGTDEAAEGTKWLQGIVDDVCDRLLRLFPACR